MPRNVLGRRLITCVNDRMRKTKTFSNACMWNDVPFVEEVFLLLCMEGSFVLLPTSDVATVVDICGQVVT